MSSHEADGIPTISLLYRLKKLLPSDVSGHTLPEPSQSLNDRIGIIRGDITKLRVDAIVNAANKRLLGGGGVDGAIHRAAGNALLEECETLGGCETGSAKITNGYKLPCKKIVHAVGPIYGMQPKEKSAKLLAGCYNTSLKLAVENECKSIAFSCLSTGVYGYPSMEAASIAIRTVREFLEGNTGDQLEKVVFCTFVEKDVDAYDILIPEYLPPTQYDIKGEEWEEIEGGESAENGSSQAVAEGANAGESQASVEKAHPEDMPDVPTKEPSDDGPAAKKLKSSLNDNVLE